MTFKVGDRVTHKKTGAHRIIVELYRDIPGGVRLDQPVEGFRSWNVADLKLGWKKRREKGGG